MNQTIASLIVSWLPLALLIGVWIFFIARMRSGPKYIRDINDRFGKQNEEIIGLLRDIKTSLENRKP